jgi:hypothetical protein
MGCLRLGMYFWAMADLIESSDSRAAPGNYLSAEIH